MTRDEATEYLIDISYKFGNISVEYLTEKDGGKMREAINVLTNEQQTCEDAISREDALMALTGEWTEPTDELIHRFIRRIKNLPSVTPQHTEAEIQKIQELEQAEIQRAYELGKAEQQMCEDAVSREAAIDAVYALCDTGETLKENPWRDNPHIDEVVETIEQIPSVQLQQPCEDAVSRQAVLDIFADNADATRPYSTAWEKIRDLPPVNPQPKIGHWIYDKIDMNGYYLNNYECSVCKCSRNVDTPYCPDCGAKMVEPQESEVRDE